MKHEELLESNTSTRKNLIGITVSSGQRNHDEGVFVKDYMADDLAKNLIAFAGMTTAAIRLGLNIHQAMRVDAYSKKVQANDLQNVQTGQRANYERSHLRTQAHATDTALKNSKTNSDLQGQIGASALDHDTSGKVVHYKNGTWASSKLDRAYHDAERNGALRNFEQSAKNYRAVPDSGFDNTTRMNNIDLYMSNGGDATIQLGYTEGGKLVQDALNMHAISIATSGAIHINPDLISPIGLGYFALRGANVRGKSREHKELTAEELEAAAKTADKPKQQALLKAAERKRKQEEAANKKKQDDEGRNNDDDGPEL